MATDEDCAVSVNCLIGAIYCGSYTGKSALVGDTGELKN